MKRHIFIINIMFISVINAITINYITGANLHKLINIQNKVYNNGYQTIKGYVYDNESKTPLIGATVIILNTNPLLGAICNEEGKFEIDNVPIGRYNIQVSYIGYISYTLKEILVGSGKEVILNIGLKETVRELEQVVVKANSSKNKALNSMATVSSKQISMEEASRYAGSADDPARLVSSYAGVASNVGNNGIVIRGNSPKGLLWRMEGVQIPNPNHFADYISLGGGTLTALSSQTMSTSDFFTGAFPAEYGNALSGVFDINMRTGNNDKREYTFQAGTLGIDVAAEGPFVKGKRSSYLFNYRYSTLGLLAPILPKEMGILTYQDLSFKLNFPIKSGTISLWGIGAYDFQGKNAEKDSTKWDENNGDKEYKTTLTMAAAGINIKRIIGNRTYIQTTIAATENSIDWTQKQYNTFYNLIPEKILSDKRWKYSFLGFINHKFNAKHTNKTGFILNRLMYNIDIDNANSINDPLVSLVSANNGKNLFQFYTQSKINLCDNLTINAGIHSQYFELNNNYTFEPRFGLNYEVSPQHSISVAYGLHTQLEIIHLYLLQQTTVDGQINTPNKNLGFNKSHHFVLSYEYHINENMNLKIEPYFQKLYDIPIVPNSYISTINISDVWNFNDSLINEGKGENYGIDISLEKYLNKGYYYMFTASLFDSKYTDGNNIKRNTRYNKNYIFNFLIGKEWQTGKENKNIFNANLKMTYMGGDRIIPLNEDASYFNKDVVLDYNNAYEKKLQDAPILFISFNYRINKNKYSGIWSLHFLNALLNKDFQEYLYNKKENKIEIKEDLLFVPSISYKIEF